MNKGQHLHARLEYTSLSAAPLMSWKIGFYAQNVGVGGAERSGFAIIGALTEIEGVIGVSHEVGFSVVPQVIGSSST